MCVDKLGRGARRFPVVALAVTLLCAWAPGTGLARARKPAKPKVDPVREQARKIFMQGQIHYKLGRFGKALVAYTRAYRLLPLAGFLFNIGQCHRFLGNYKQAVHFYKVYLRETPGAPNLAVVETLIRRAQAKLVAQTVKRKAAEAAFKDGVRLYALGQVRQALAKFQTAYQELRSAGYRYHIAQCHRKLGEYKQALFHYRGYLNDNPATPMANLVAGYIKECEQRLKEAELKRRGVFKPDQGNGTDGGQGKKNGPVVVPVYKKWWLWTLVGVGVTALAVGLGVGLTMGSNSYPDTVLGPVNWKR